MQTTGVELNFEEPMQKKEHSLFGPRGRTVIPCAAQRIGRGGVRYRGLKGRKKVKFKKGTTDMKPGVKQTKNPVRVTNLIGLLIFIKQRRPPVIVLYSCRLAPVQLRWTPKGKKSNHRAVSLTSGVRTSQEGNH